MTTTPRDEPPTNALIQELERVHDMLRHDLRACQDLADAARAGAPAAELRGAVDQLGRRSPHLRLGVDCMRFCGLVHAHHGGEDQTLFPLVRRDAPHLAPVVDRLEADHRVVSHLLDQIEAAVDRLDLQADATRDVVEALDALSDHLLAHLTLEERALRPFLLSLDGWPTDERAS
ncbi:hemerythrin domain-containing protein [Cellulomonas humilata]|uniref:Hemerythrin domain-containing protein n=1 Tax=Cellulomonas humilata TaxID=144055 RepID=A0A7Y6A3H7_9CELL|nr:hemerythrin domain-containing protein [Cellulomonas humilata]NUU18423.1 hemerythrin domain-containing protein [Cellulomonas humilata]